MWHRGIPCGMLSEELLAQEDHDGPWNYFLLYRPQPPDAEEPDPGRNFHVLDVCSVAEIARRWRRSGRGILMFRCTHAVDGTQQAISQQRRNATPLAAERGHNGNGLTEVPGPGA